MENFELKVKGIRCKSCEMLIKDALEETSGVIEASVKKDTVRVKFDKDKVTKKKLIEIIKAQGYEV